MHDTDPYETLILEIDREDRPRREQDEYRRRGPDEKNTGAGGEFVRFSFFFSRSMVRCVSSCLHDADPE